MASSEFAYSATSESSGFETSIGYPVKLASKSSINLVLKKNDCNLILLAVNGQPSEPVYHFPIVFEEVE